MKKTILVLVILAAVTGGLCAQAKGPKPTLKIVRLESPTVAIANEGAETKLVEQVTGYKVSIEYYDSTTAADKVILDIAGGKVIDIILPTGVAAPQIYSALTQLGKSKAVVDMGPLLDTYAPDLKAVFPKDTWDACKVNGKNYFAPTEGFDIAQIGDIVRGDILANMNMSMPKSMDDLVTLLKAVKQKDPAGVGVDNVIPLSFQSTRLPFFPQYGINWPFKVKNGRLVPRIQLPETREYVQFMKKLYDEGLADRDFMVSKMDVITQKALASRIFMVGNQIWTTLYSFRDLADKQKLDIAFTMVPPFKGPHGDSKVPSSFGIAMGAIIPSTSQSPEHVMQYLNAWAKGENFKSLFCGIEGVHHKVVNGEIYPILPKYNEEVGNMNLLLPVAPRDVYFKYWLPRTRKLPIVEKSFSDVNKTYTGFQEKNPLALAMSFPTYSAKSASLNQMENDMYLKMIVGAEKIVNWDSLVKTWLQAGGADAIKEVNDWYAARK